MHKSGTLIATAAAALMMTCGPSLAQSAERLNTLGPENGEMAELVGSCDVVETVWSAAGAAPVVTRGAVAERRTVGSYLEQIVRSPSGTVLRTR